MKAQNDTANAAGAGAGAGGDGAGGCGRDAPLLAFGRVLLMLQPVYNQVGTGYAS